GLKSCFIEVCPADAKIASLLEIGEGEKVVCIHRIKTANETPICLIKNYIPLTNVPDIDLDAKIPVLYDYLKEKYGIVYTGSKDVISALNANFEQASLLEIEPKSALLHVQRICYQAGRPMEVDMVDMIADVYEYEIFLGEKNQK
ncbi:MAG: UTRA domain-containing protein, partial [Clostridia bacterium]|nr:UTRA domain-containing protein [Clostridia bacterium]